MSRQTPFQTKHELEFGLKIVKCSSLRVVETVQCQFCVHNGRETRVGPGVKRKCTNNMKIYTLPFQSEQYRQHLTSQHTDNWANYHLLDLKSKRKYFDDKEVRGIHKFVDNAKDNLKFVIHRSNIVNSLIGELFFNPEQEEENDDSTPITKVNAMKLLIKIQEDGSYLVTIKKPLCFWLAIDHTFVGISFCQTATVITQH
jgi:hypothetical protein